MWLIEYTDEFETWWNELSSDEQESVAFVIRMLGREGVHIKSPYSSGINTSRHTHMRELRAQHKGDPYRVLYAFDPRRAAILLIGGNKRGDKRWYKTFIPIADRLYDEHLQLLREEGLIDG